jgi:hypothetical protein
MANTKKNMHSKPDLRSSKCCHDVESASNIGPGPFACCDNGNENNGGSDSVDGSSGYVELGFG